MATQAHQNSNQNPKRVPLFPLLALLIFASIFFLLSISKKTSSSSFHSSSLSYSQIFKPNDRHHQRPCNYSDGKWIYDPNFRFNGRYDSTCKEIFKGWNCLLNNKSNAGDIPKWRWKPNACHLHPFDPLKFLHNYRDTNIGTLLFYFYLGSFIGVAKFAFVIVGESC